jgi:2EXR family
MVYSLNFLIVGRSSFIDRKPVLPDFPSPYTSASPLITFLSKHPTASTHLTPGIFRHCCIFNQHIPSTSRLPSNSRTCNRLKLPLNMVSTTINEDIVSDQEVQSSTESQHTSPSNVLEEEVLSCSGQQQEDESELDAESEPEPNLEPTAVIKPIEEHTFTLFPKLAPELRIRIWKEACNVTRNVDLWVHDSGKIGDYLAGDPHFFTSGCRPPSILGACREFRAEGLKHYTLDFGVQVEVDCRDRVPYTISIPPRVYFHWNCDRLCLMNPHYFFWGYHDDNHNSWLDLRKRCEEKKLRFKPGLNLSATPNEGHEGKTCCWLEGRLLQF